VSHDDRAVQAEQLIARMKAARGYIYPEWELAAQTDPDFTEGYKVIEANPDHIIDDLVANFIANLPAGEVYHAAQERGFTWGAVRAPEELLDDAHLHDQGFWKQVEHPELGRSFVYHGEAAIYNGSPWRLSRRVPLIGEHNQDIFCGELGLSPQELSMLAESRVI
jgi:crotonobetainyl-CoA:carnitine CoA-transferase CaiB-like acyl-CoA transferase